MVETRPITKIIDGEDVWAGTPNINSTGKYVAGSPTGNWNWKITNDGTGTVNVRFEGQTGQVYPLRTNEDLNIDVIAGSVHLAKATAGTVDTRIIATK